MIYFSYQTLLAIALLFVVYLQAKKSPLNFLHLWNLILGIVVCGTIGGRLAHVFYEAPFYYWSDPIKVFYLWEGGFVFYGAFFSCLLFVWAYCLLHALSFLSYADFYAPIFALTYAFGRLGCWLAGCCYGRFCDAFWCIDQKHPTQLYAFATEILLALWLWLRTSRHPGETIGIWFIGHALGRLFMESFRADDRGAAIAGFSIGTWLSLAVLALGAYILGSAERKTT